MHLLLVTTFHFGPFAFFSYAHPGLPSMAENKSRSATSPFYHPQPKTSRVPEKARNVGAARFNPGIIFKKRKREKRHPPSSAPPFINLWLFSVYPPPAPTLVRARQWRRRILAVRGTCEPPDHKQEKFATTKKKQQQQAEEKKKVDADACHVYFSCRINRGVALFLLCRARVRAPYRARLIYCWGLSHPTL